MKKIIKRLLIIASIIFGLLLIAAVAIPYMYRDEIKAKALESVNKSLDAFVTIGDVDITLISSFPYLGVRFDQIGVFGKKEFAGVPLFSADRLSLGLNLMSVIKGDKPLTIREITLTKPLINIQVLENGKANYDISKDTTKSSSGEDFRLLLSKYQIINGNIVYNDKSMDVFTEMKGLNHTGSGDFGSSLFDLKTTTTCDSLSLVNGAISVLKNAKLKYDATLSADMLNKKFTFQKNSLKLNEIELKADGFVKMNTNDKEMDLVLSCPQNSFKNLLSMIPGAYTADFKDVKADGNFKLNAKVKGKLSETSIPSFDVAIAIDHGTIKYPSLPKSIQNIQTNINIVNKGNQADQTVIDVNPLKLSIDNQPFEATINIKTPVSDPNVDAKMKGTLNLGDLSQAFPMQGMKELKGIIKADVVLKAKNSDIQAERYQNVNVGGTMAISGMAVNYTPYPRVLIDQANVVFSPKNITLSQVSGKLGRSDVQGSGKVDNFMAYFSPKLTMKGNVNIKSNFFDASEWMKAMEQSDSKSNNKEPDAANVNQKVFDRFDFGVKGNITKLIYEKYEINQLAVDGNIKPNNLDVNNLSFNMGKSDFKTSGSIVNIFNWLFKNQTLGGNINFSSRYLDLNPFMAEDPNAPAVKPEPMAIPANVNMDISANIAKMDYTNMSLNNVSGKLIVADEAIKISQGTAETMGGKMNISGGYNSRDIAKPGFAIKLNMLNMSFQEVFKTMNTVQKLAPIAQYIQGNFNTDLSMSGILTKEMTPDLNTLQMDGFLETLTAIIKNFKPLSEIGTKLNVKEFNNFELKNTKNWISVKDGAVEVKDFDYNFKNIAMTIGGKHSLTKDMDYKIKAKIPRKMLEGNAVGAAAYSGIGFLGKEASKYGVNISVGEFVNVLIGIGGVMSSPKLSFKVLGTDGGSASDQVTAGANAAIGSVKDSLKRRTEQEIDKAKERAREQADKIVDSLQKVANKKIDEAIKKTTEQVQDKVGKELGDKAKSEAEKAKEQLKKYNPFKKK